jgi:hypothetical protein
MSSVLDTIRRVLGRDRGNRPDPAAQTDAGAPVRAGTAEGVMPPAAGAPALAMPGEEAEAPIQATAPPAMPASPPAAAEPPVAVSAAQLTTGAESEAEPTEPPGPESDATTEPRGQGNVQAIPLPAPVLLVEETVTHIDMEEPWSAAAAGHATVVEETVQAIVVEGPVAEMAGHEQSLGAETLASSDAPDAPDQSQESATAAPPTRPEGSPEPPTAMESPTENEDR